jgi:hypothetical protein
MKFEPRVKAFAKWLLNIFFGTAVGLLMFAISLIIAGVLMATAKSGGLMAKDLFVRLAGDRGAEFDEISVKTVAAWSKESSAFQLYESCWQVWGLPWLEFPLPVFGHSCVSFWLSYKSESGP